MTTLKKRTFMCDFETTVYDNQQSTEVWAAACVELFTENVHIFHSIEEQYDYFLSLKEDIIVYYHNLKFDGSFWLDYLITKLGYQQAAIIKGNVGESYDIEWSPLKFIPNRSFQYSISAMGQWYKILIKPNSSMTIEIRDSLKLLPFSVKKIGKSFGTKHKKLDMEYKGYRYAGCEITNEEQKYIANDVLVVKEALEIMFTEGHSKLTIGACCLSEFKNTYPDKTLYETFFPNLYETDLDVKEYGSPTIGDYIRKAYRGGWCYLVKGKENVIKTNGTTADVNSLYPSMMSSESGNYYPVGTPTFWKGNYIPEIIEETNRYFFIRIKTRFYIKENYLPFIQSKHSLLYEPTESLTTSDIYDEERGCYVEYYKDDNGNPVSTAMTMTMTCTDYKLFREHYNVKEFEILDGCYFFTEIGLFDEYIEKYKKIKLVSKGAKRELAKLFLNNLCGKMAASTDSSFKYAIKKEDGSIGFITINEHKKKPGYIPIGAAITSYARNFTIRAAQANYYDVNERGFIYADTDSIHCDLEPEEIKGITVHDKNFCCWKLESCWDIGYFTRQKTYIEHVTKEDMEVIDKPYYNIKCAGMPERCKQLFQLSMQGYYPNNEEERSEYSKDELKFLKTKRTIEDFTEGLKVPGKLLPKRIPGGIILKDTFYEMR